MQDQGTCGDVLRDTGSIHVACRLYIVSWWILAVAACGKGQGRVCVGYMLGGEGKGERSRISVMVFESMDRLYNRVLKYLK